jgi:hypothetical protein
MSEKDANGCKAEGGKGLGCQKEGVSRVEPSRVSYFRKVSRKKGREEGKRDIYMRD